jgi:bifunctional non-homologous end joining protein LigD
MARIGSEGTAIDKGTNYNWRARGEFGGGTVMLRDRGWWEPLGDAGEGYAKGNLKFILHGEKLQGRWALVRMARRERDESDRPSLRDLGSKDA